MSKLEQTRRHALECLRLEADCMQLAGAANGYNLRKHFIRMARVWSTMAFSGPSANAGQAFAAAKTQPT